jgi:hypothetical protein
MQEIKWKHVVLALYWVSATGRFMKSALYLAFSVVAITIELLEPGMCSKVQRQIKNICTGVELRLLSRYKDKLCAGQSRNQGLNTWQHPYQFWSLPSLLSREYQGSKVAWS